MTEDMIEEHTTYISSLTDEDDRSRAQLDILLSDMQAFKAANPGCCLEDFVRWHSPRDWVPTTDAQDGQSSGVLSERMQIPGNLWVETWHTAKAVPVSQQARLFNETKEAEKVFHYLSGGVRLGELVELLMPVVLVEVTRVLIAKCKYTVTQIII